MPGSEWTNDDEPERRDDARPLSPEVEARPEPVRIPGVSRPPAQPREPAMAHAPSDRDESARADPSEGEKPGPRKTSGGLSTFLALLSKIPLPSLGRERHEMMPDAPDPAASQAEGKGSEPTAPRAHAGTKRAPGRFPFLAMKRETRVGIAALISFIFLVVALVNKRGWIGGKPITVAIGGPSSPSPDSTPPTPDSSSSTKATPKSEEAKDKQTNKDKKKSQDKKESQESKSESAPRVGDEPKLPVPAPDDQAPLKSTLLVDPTATEPATLPPTGPEAMKPATLASTTESTSPPSLPTDLPPTGTEPSAASTATAQPSPPVGTPESSPPSLPAPPTLSPTASVEPSMIPADSKPPASVEPSMIPVDSKPPASVEPSMIPVDSKPPATVLNPPPADGPPPATEPSAMPTSPAEKTQAPSAVAEATPPPIPTPTPTPTQAPASAPAAATAPVLAERPPKLEEVPAISAAAGPIESAATKTSAVGAVGALSAGWVVIPSGGRRIAGASTIVSTPSSEDQAAPPRVADGPRVSDDLAADQVEPVVHVVRAGENFWTISRLYYRSGRFYRALHAANRRQVPKIDELYVGTVLRIPPPEALDRSLIDPPGPTTSTVSRTSKRVDAIEDADLAMPAVRPRMIRPDPEAVEAPRRPTYTTKPHETLRSIARDTLSDPRRDREIYNLNRDVLSDINVLEPGTTLTLPEDAIVGRRSR